MLVEFTAEQKNQAWVFDRFPHEYIDKWSFASSSWQILCRGTAQSGDLKKRLHAAVTTLRLVSLGDIGAPTVIRPWVERPLATSSGATALSAMGARLQPHSAQYILTTEVARRAKELYPHVLQQGDRLELAFRRFNEAYARTAPEDRLVDLTIALEASLLAGTKGKLQKRLGQRGACLVSQAYAGHDTDSFLRCLYDCRSRIVHDGVRLPALLGTIRRKTTCTSTDAFVAASEELVRLVLGLFVVRLDREGLDPRGLCKKLDEECEAPLAPRAS